MNRRTPYRSAQRICAAVLVGLTGASLSSCVGTPASDYETQRDVQCPISPAEASGTLRLGYQVLPGSELYTLDRGLAEACLPNAHVTWTKLSTGQDVVQGFAADSIDVGFLGSTPAAKALSRPLGLDVIVPSVSRVIGSSEALVAKSAQSIAELRGKKIATAFSSTSHYSLLSALKKAGLDPAHDVEIINIAPDKLPAAWRSGEIDAAYIWDPTLTEIKKSGHVLIDSEQVARDGSPTYNVTLAGGQWTQHNPELLRKWLELQAWVVQHSLDDEPDFVQANSVQIQMSPEQTEAVLAGAREVRPDEQRSVLNQARGVLVNTARFLAEQKEVSVPLSEEQAQRSITEDYLPSEPGRPDNTERNAT